VSYPNNPRVWLSLIVAAFNGVDIEYDFKDFKMGETNRTPEFLAVNPFGKVPTLFTDATHGVFESKAIARFVAKSGNGSMYGGDSLAQGQVDGWLDWCALTFEAANFQWIGPIMGYLKYNKKIEQEAVKKIKGNMQFLNKYLSTRTFLVGERLTLADVAIFLALGAMVKMVFDEKFRKPYGHVFRWFKTIAAMDKVTAVTGELVWCETPMKWVPPKKDKKQKGKKKQQQQKKKPKPKDEFADLEKSSFSIEDFKTHYANDDPRTQSIPFLMKNFDSKGWSMWKADFKYQEENEFAFKSRNLVGGMFNRISAKLKKYAFACCDFVGEESGPHDITQFWIIRGQKLPQLLLDCDDSELYDWVKIDFDADSTPDLVMNMLGWDEKCVVNGKPWLCSKLFGM